MKGKGMGPHFFIQVYAYAYSPMSESVRNNPTELLDPENVGAAILISLLCSLEAEIMRFSYVLPVMSLINHSQKINLGSTWGEVTYQFYIRRRVDCTKGSRLD